MDEEDRLDFGEEEDLEDQISLGEADIDAKEDQDQDITQTRESSTNDNSGHGGLSHAAAGSAAGATASIDSKVDGADEAPLPPGWVARLSRQGELYYLHEPTKQSTWDRPTETVESSVSSPRAPEQSAVSDDTTTGTAKNKEKAAAAKTQPVRAETDGRDEVSQQGVSSARWGRERQAPQQQAFDSKSRVDSSVAPKAPIRSARDVAASAGSKQSTPEASQQVQPVRKTNKEDRPTAEMNDDKAPRPVTTTTIPTGPRADRRAAEQPKQTRAVANDRPADGRPPTEPAAYRSRARDYEPAGLSAEPSSSRRVPSDRFQRDDSRYPRDDRETGRNERAPIAASTASSRYENDDLRDRRSADRGGPSRDMQPLPRDLPGYGPLRDRDTASRPPYEYQDRRGPVPVSAPSRALADRGWSKRDVEDPYNNFEPRRDNGRRAVSPTLSSQRRPVSPAPARSERPRSPPPRLAGSDGPQRRPDAREVARAAAKKTSAPSSPRPSRQWTVKQPSPIFDQTSNAPEIEKSQPKDNAAASATVSEIAALTNPSNGQIKETKNTSPPTNIVSEKQGSTSTISAKNSKVALSRSADQSGSAVEDSHSNPIMPKSTEKPGTASKATATGKPGPVRAPEKRQVSASLAHRLDAPLDDRQGLSMKRALMHAPRHRSRSPPANNSYDTTASAASSSSFSLAERMIPAQPSLLARLNGEKQGRGATDEGDRGQETGRPNKRNRLSERLSGDGYSHDSNMTTDESSGLGSRLGVSKNDREGDTAASKGMSIFGAGRTKEGEHPESQKSQTQTSTGQNGKTSNSTILSGIASLPSKPVTALPRPRDGPPPGSNPALLDSYRPGHAPRRDSDKTGPPPIRDSYIPHAPPEKVIDRYMPPPRPYDRGGPATRGGFRVRDTTNEEMVCRGTRS